MAKASVRTGPRGRALDETALLEVQTALGTTPRRRDLLIEHLHRLQDRYGHLTERHLKALAHEMTLAEVEVFEVASFYHHFDIVKDTDAAPPPLTIRVCDSVSCMLAGAEALLNDLDGYFDPTKVRILRSSCIGRCDQAPAAMVSKQSIAPATLEHVQAAVHGTQAPPQRHERLEDYRKRGGYEQLGRLISGKISPSDIIACLSQAGLKGLGGAGFPAGRKWNILRAMSGTKLMTINADEGEPGTFKDRHLLETTPHKMLEGALIAAEVVGAERIYLYLRDEYPDIHAILTAEIEALRTAQLLFIPIEIRRGAGAYICGEESAMLESIEGKRGLPRHRPPFIAEKGLFGCPTLNHNVETLSWIARILRHGPEWFADQGRRGAKGLRSFSVSGRIKHPGVKIAPAGITVLELISEYCGGMQEGHELAGYLPGGASGGILPAKLADLPLDFGSLDPYGCFVGSHAVVVFSHTDDPRAIARNLMRFFAHESCGQCTPCRIGTAQLSDIMEKSEWDVPLMDDIEQVMRDASICGLGQAAPNPMRSILRFFAEEQSL